MRFEFDKIITKYKDGEKLEYGFIFGNEKVVFIKVGAGENIRKFQDNYERYVEIAKRANKYYGATVICASNPDFEHEIIDEKAIRFAVENQGFDNFELYLWGISDGAYKNLTLAKRFAETVKVIGLNTSYISLEDLEEKLRALPKVKKFFIYGTEDEDFDSVFPTLRNNQNEYLKIISVRGADHRFTDLPLPVIHSIDLIEDDKTKEVDSYWKET